MLRIFLSRLLSGYLTVVVCIVTLIALSSCVSGKDSSEEALPSAEDISFDELNSTTSTLAVYWNPYPAIRAGARSFTAQLVKNSGLNSGDIYSTNLSATYSTDNLEYPGKAVFTPLKEDAKYLCRVRANYPGGRRSAWAYLQNPEKGGMGVLKVGKGVVDEPVSLIQQTSGKLVLATSSTLSFSFSSTGWKEPDTDAERTYRIALYRDEACTDLEVSWSIFPGCGTGFSADNQQHFLFSGLEPSSTYYFQAIDETESPSASPVLVAETAAFTPVTVPATANAGDIILAEDFGELIWGGSYLNGEAAAGYSSKARGNAPRFEKARGENPIGGQYQYYLVGIGQDMQLFGSLTYAIPSSRLAEWGYMSEDENNTALMCAQAGHIKCGTGAGLAEIVTPALSCLSGSAKVKVDFVAQRLSTGDGQNLIVEVLRDARQGEDFAVTVEDNKRFTALQTSVSSTSKAVPVSIEINDVRPGDRIAIGGDPFKKTGYTRFFIDEIVITLISYN